MNFVFHGKLHYQNSNTNTKINDIKDGYDTEPSVVSFALEIVDLTSVENDSA